MDLAKMWPLFDVELRTPDLLLRPMRDEDLPGLAAAALEGIHDRDRMPFSVPWTDQAPDVLPAELARFQWETRASVRPWAWNIEFAVIRDGVVIGAQGLGATAFPVRKSVETGSWLTRAAQGQGLGTQMRRAVLTLAFDEFGAEWAHTAAAVWNEASAGVSRTVGYRENGRTIVTGRAGESVESVSLRLHRDDFVRADLPVTVTGAEAARTFLGILPEQQHRPQI